MRLVENPGFELIFPVSYAEAKEKILKAARICYKSENADKKRSDEELIKHIIESGHHSVLEHVSLTVKIVTNRGVSHEFVRHRLASFSQESTRYCNYSKERFGNEITIMMPSNKKLDDIISNLDGVAENESDGVLGSTFKVDSGVMYKILPDLSTASKIWLKSCLRAESDYFDLLKAGFTPQEARGILPNDLKTEFLVTANIREWRLILTQRTSPKAHPDMRALMVQLHEWLIHQYPIFFEDVNSN